MTTISAVIITYNEERNIERLLLSIKDVVDEIIVVDSFSTDQTKIICAAYPVKFIEHKWEGYANTKNFANSLVQSEYILSLDADEALSEELKQSILNEKSKGLEGVYEFNRLTNYCGKWIKHGGWYPDKKIRIFPKNKVKWQGDFVHETLFITDDLKVNFLKGDLLHYSYYNENEHYERIKKYAQLSAQELYNNQKKYSSIKGYLSALSKFIKMYIIDLGILDGKQGFVIAKISAYGAYLKYQLLKALNEQ